MNTIKKFLTGVILTIVAIFILESVYNWKESKAAFMEAYYNGLNSD
jgi:hypothetical protein